MDGYQVEREVHYLSKLDSEKSIVAQYDRIIQENNRFPSISTPDMKCEKVEFGEVIRVGVGPTV